MARFENYRDALPNARAARIEADRGYGLALGGISAADVARSMAAGADAQIVAGSPAAGH